LILLKYPLKLKCWKSKTDKAFIEISQDLADKIQKSGSDYVIRMLERLQRKSLRLRILVACYQGLQIVRHQGILDCAKKHGFKWNDNMDYEQNLRILSGIIKRIENELKQDGENYTKITEKTRKDADNHNLSDIIANLNYIANSNLTMDSSLENFVSVNKLSQEIVKQNKKNN